MANRTLSDLPVTTIVAGADIIHCRQSVTDKSVSQTLIAEYVQTLSDYSPTVVSVTGAAHTIDTTIRKQLIICTISSNCTMTFPGSYGDAKEIIIRNESGSTANVIGLPNSEVLYPGLEITFIWNGSAWVKRGFTTHILTGTTVPTVIPSFLGQTFIDDTNNNIYIAVGTASSADWVLLQRKIQNISTQTANFTITDSETYDKYIINHSASTAQITGTLPTLADNQNKRYMFQNNGHGMTSIDGEGAEVLLFQGNSLTNIKLLMSGDYIEIIGTSSGWLVEHCYLSMITNWVNRSDWTNVHIGSSFAYDNKSSGVDLTGQHFQIADGGALQKGIIVHDSGSTGLSGIMYVYSITDSSTSLGVWTNNQVCTCGSGGYTFIVNEPSGSSKDIDYVLYPNFEFRTHLTEFYINTSTTYSSAINQLKQHGAFAVTAPDEYGWQGFCLTDNGYKIQTATGGLIYIDDSGDTSSFVTTNGYCTMKFEYSF